MKLNSPALFVVGWALAGSAALAAQNPAAAPRATGSALTVQRSIAGPAQPKAAASASPSQADITSALQAVAQFLQLTQDQQNVLGQLLQARQQALAPILQGIATLQNQLDQLLESGGSPAAIGQTAIQIHALEKQAAQVQQGFLARWESLLDPGQQQRLETARVAATLQPLVPAFQLLQLL